MAEKAENSVPFPPRISLHMAVLRNDSCALRAWHSWSMRRWLPEEKPRLRGRNSWAWDVNQDSNLHRAARAGDAATVEDLLNKGDSPRSSNGHAEYPLMLAARAGHLGTVKVFLQHKAHSYTVGTALSVAGSKEVAAALGQRAKLRAINAALVKAVQFDRPTTVAALLVAGADPNAKTSYGSPVLAVAATGGQYGCVMLLLQAGANGMLPTNYGQGPLHCAAMTGNPELVSAILEAGVPVDQKDRDGNTALFYAARFGQVSSAEVLLRAGANIHMRNVRACTALHIAACEGSEEVAMYLLSKGANPIARNKQGQSPWQLALTQALRDRLRRAERVKSRGRQRQVITACSE